MAKISVALEMELDITAEEGVNNEDVNPEDLFSKLEEINAAYEALSKVPRRGVQNCGRQCTWRVPRLTRKPQAVPRNTSPKEWAWSPSQAIGLRVQSIDCGVFK